MRCEQAKATQTVITLLRFIGEQPTHEALSKLQDWETVFLYRQNKAHSGNKNHYYASLLTKLSHVTIRFNQSEHKFRKNAGSPVQLHNAPESVVHRRGDSRAQIMPGKFPSKPAVRLRLCV